MRKELAQKELWMNFSTVTDCCVWGMVWAENLAKTLAEKLSAEELEQFVKEVWKLKAEREVKERKEVVV